MVRQSRDIKYINKEFKDLRSDLKEFAKNYFPETYTDFSADSPGMMFIEMASYVGDVLGFYQDKQFQETFPQHAASRENLYALANTVGYKPKIVTASQAELTVSQIVPAINGEPDFTYAGILPENSTITASTGGGVSFITLDRVDFTTSTVHSPTQELIHRIEDNEPVEFRLVKKVKAISGNIVTVQRTFTLAEKFKTIEIVDTGIIEIISIEDTAEDKWREVPFLGQDTVFKETTNEQADKSIVPYILEVERTPKRFITRVKSNNVLEIQFGAGIVELEDEEYIPTPTDIESNRINNESSLFNTYNPSNFLSTRTYGLAPSNTTLTIKYLKGEGIQSNVPSNTITQLQTQPLPSDPTKTEYLETIEIFNELPGQGGGGPESIEELRQNIRKTYAEQGRAITPQDYAIRILSLPARYGRVSKIFTGQDSIRPSQIEDPLATSIYMLGKDDNNNLVEVTPSLSNNIKQYLSQFTGVLDKVRLKQAYIVNIGIQYEIIPLPGENSREVLTKVTSRLKELFDVSKQNINQPINLSKIYTEIDKVDGVQTVQDVKIINKVGEEYSKYGYDIKGATRNNIIYPSIDPMIFEVKFLEKDIEGKTTTL